MNKTAERPRARSLNPLRALIPFLKPYRTALYAAMGALLVASAAMLSLPVALRQLIDHGPAIRAGLKERRRTRTNQLFRYHWENFC